MEEEVMHRKQVTVAWRSCGNGLSLWDQVIWRPCGIGNKVFEEKWEHFQEQMPGREGGREGEQSKATPVSSWRCQRQAVSNEGTPASG